MYKKFRGDRAGTLGSNSKKRFHTMYGMLSNNAGVGGSGAVLQSNYFVGTVWALAIYWPIYWPNIGDM